MWDFKQTPLVGSGRIAFKAEQSYFVMKQNVQVSASASYSVILSLASYLLHHHPTLKPPNFNWNEPLKYKINNIELVFNDLYQPWCDYMFSQIEKGKGVQEGTKFYMIIQVDANYLTELRDFQDFFQKIFKATTYKEKIEKAFQITVNMQQNTKKKKIGIAYLGDAQNRNPGQCLRPKINLPSLLAGIWFGNYQWKKYDILKKHYPSQKQIQELHVLILTGSSHSVLDNIPEIQYLKPIIQKGLMINPSFRVVGLCFGHQLLAKFSGGLIVTKNRRNGLHQINVVAQNIKNYSFLQPFTRLKGQKLYLNQFNGDFVESLPKNLVNLATGPRCNSQAFISLDQRFLGFQFHPEYSYQYLQAIIQQMSKFSEYNQIKRPIIITHSDKRHLQSLDYARTVIKLFFQKQ